MQNLFLQGHSVIRKSSAAVVHKFSKLYLLIKYQREIDITLKRLLLQKEESLTLHITAQQSLRRVNKRAQ